MAKLTLTLSEETLERLRAEAAEAGMAVEAWATRRLGMAEDAAPFTRGDSDASEALRRLEAYDRSRDSVDGEEALNAFVAKVEARAAPVPFVGGQADVSRQDASVAALAAYDHTGQAHALEDVLIELRADLETRLSARA